MWDRGNVLHSLIIHHIPLVLPILRPVVNFVTWIRHYVLHLTYWAQGRQKKTLPSSAILSSAAVIGQYYLKIICTSFINFKTGCKHCHMNLPLCYLREHTEHKGGKKKKVFWQYYLKVNLFCYYGVVNYFLPWNFWGATTWCVCNLFGVVVAVPAEVQQGTCGGGDALCRPAQQMKLGQSARLLSLNVLQVETTNQEVFTPDVFGHQIHLRHTRKNR